MNLTNEEKKAIKVLNFVATFDGVIEDAVCIEYLLNEGIKKFIPKKRQHLVSVNESVYPIRIVIHREQ